jgi:hypothetical protein
MNAHACVFFTRAGFTQFGRLATLIIAFRGRIGFASAAARTVRIAGLQQCDCSHNCLLRYMLHRHFTW